MLFRITAVAPEEQAVKALGQWTVSADTGEQAISRLLCSAMPSTDFWPSGSKWMVEPVDPHHSKLEELPEIATTC